MKTLVISYSFTGNNGKLANKLAQSIYADYSVLKENNRRTIFTILLDVIFNRTPKIIELENHINQYEHLIFVAPIWFGKIATPLRALFKELNGKTNNYSLITLSAGYDGKNPNLEKELIKRTGLEPIAVLNPIISEILPSNPKPSRKKLEAYRLSDTAAD